MTERTADEIKAAVLERYGSHAREQLKKTEQIELTASGEESCCDPSPSAEGPAEETSSWAEKFSPGRGVGGCPQGGRDRPMRARNRQQCPHRSNVRRRP